MKGIRTDLIIEAEGLEAGMVSAGTGQQKKVAEIEGVTVKEEWNKDNSLKLTVVQIENEAGAKAMGRPTGTYITMELPGLLEEEETLKEIAERELSRQLKELLKGNEAEHILVVGLGNREVTADAIGPLTVDSLIVTRHYFQEESVSAAVGKKYRKVSAFTPGVMAQTGMETMELIRGVVEQIKPDIVFAVDALAARSPNRLNTTIQLTDTGISPGAGVGNNRKELNETSLGCPVIAIGVPTVLDAVTIAKEEVSEDVRAFFVMPRNIDSSVQYVSELLAGGINRVHQKNGI
jgi:spore protease